MLAWAESRAVLWDARGTTCSKCNAIDNRVDTFAVDAMWHAHALLTMGSAEEAAAAVGLTLLEHCV